MSNRRPNRIQSRIPVLRKETFTFERQKLATTVTKIRKKVDLKGELFNKTTPPAEFQIALEKNLAVSPSGRTLSHILSLSYPEELWRYNIQSVSPSFGTGGSLVTYSRSESTEELLRMLEELNRKVEASMTVKKCSEEALEKQQKVLEKWQCANLVLYAFGTFVWARISQVDKDELAQYGMKNFLDLFYSVKSGKPQPARNVARRIYEKIDMNLKALAEQIMTAKRDVGNSQKNLAHPDIPDTCVEEFLKDLGYGDPDLEPLEIAVFDHLKLTTNSDANVQEASHGYT